MSGLRERRPIALATVTSLADELEQLLDGLRKALATADDASPAEVDAGRADEVLVRLRQFLETGDIAAVDLARSEEALLRAVLGPVRWPGFQRHINSFSFEKALASLDS
jgi:hypothetical protein